MEKEKVIKELENLRLKFDSYGMQCYREIGFLQAHKFEMEEMALRYKIEAFHKCKMDVFLLIDELNKKEE